MAGGKAVATAIGNILEIPVYDYELLSQAAVESGLSHELFKRSDETRRVLNLGNIFGANRYSQSSIGSGINDSELFNIQCGVIRRIAESGSAIFVGRAADYVLRDMRCLNVFVSSPDETRIKRTCEQEGVDAETAAKLIARADRQRANFYNYYSFRNWGEAANYHLCVNSSLLGVEGTARMIIDFGKQAGLIG